MEDMVLDSKYMYQPSWKYRYHKSKELRTVSKINSKYNASHRRKSIMAINTSENSTTNVHIYYTEEQYIS